MKRTIPFIAGGGALFVLVVLVILNALSFQTTSKEPLVVQKTKASTVTYRKNVAIDQVNSISPTTQISSSQKPTDILLAQNQSTNKNITISPTKIPSPSPTGQPTITLTISPTENLLARGGTVSISPSQQPLISVTTIPSGIPTTTLTKIVSVTITGTPVTQLPKTGKYEYLIVAGLLSILVITFSFVL